MRVLIIGLGSIGHKHLQALVNIGVKEIAALRTGLGQKKLENDVYTRLKEFNNINDVLAWQPSHIIISNPTSLHIDFINFAIENNINFFVEKPIADNFIDLNKLKKIDTNLGIVGYNLRFHKVFMKIKELIDSKELGDVLTANLHVGQYLPSWHPYEDYSKAYYARKALGGGALRTLSHEIDLIQYFFGNVKSVYSTVERLSSLDIDVDDVVNILAETERCKRVSVHINYLDPTVDRSGAIYFSTGVLKYDYLKSEIVFVGNDAKTSVLFNSTVEISDQYEQQMNAFLNGINIDYACGFKQGVDVMRIIEACEESSINKKEICLA